MSDELDNCFSLGKSLKIVFYTTTLQNTIKLPVEKYIFMSIAKFPSQIKYCVKDVPH